MPKTGTITKNTTLVSIIIVILCVLLVWIVLERADTKDQVADNDNVACTMEAKQCPDGSYVGRTGPQCEFTACPAPVTTVSTTTVTVSFNQTKKTFFGSLTPTSLVEDSRCPSDVQCIQAGTVKVAVSVSGGMGTTTQVLELGKPFTTESETITLVGVNPKKLSTTTIATREYIFTFYISKR